MAAWADSNSRKESALEAGHVLNEKISLARANRCPSIDLTSLLSCSLFPSYRNHQGPDRGHGRRRVHISRRGRLYRAAARDGEWIRFERKEKELGTFLLLRPSLQGRGAPSFAVSTPASFPSSSSVFTIFAPPPPPPPQSGAQRLPLPDLQGGARRRSFPSGRAPPRQLQRLVPEPALRVRDARRLRLAGHEEAEPHQDGPQAAAGLRRPARRLLHARRPGTHGERDGRRYRLRPAARVRRAADRLLGPDRRGTLPVADGSLPGRRRQLLRSLVLVVPAAGADMGEKTRVFSSLLLLPFSVPFFLTKDF